VERYQIATKKFLKEFDSCWEETLTILGNNQSQLIAGSRLRPQICLWGFLSMISLDEVDSFDYSHIANVAVSIELIHKASLLIDDWIDGDYERHGYPAFHAEYSPEYSVLYALNMIGLSMSRLGNVFSDSIILPQYYTLCINTLINTIYSMAQGALKELQLRENDFFDNEKIKAIAQLETADIISNSFLLGYYVSSKGNTNPGIVHIFKEIGDQCGYLFQTYNDLEAFCNPKTLYEHKGSLNLDFTINRKNIVISTLFSVATKKDQKVLKNANDSTILQMVEKYKIIESLQIELALVFENILSSVSQLSKYDLSIEWQLGLKTFLKYVKSFATKRLKA